MRRSRHQSQTQLVLGLERANPEPLVERGTKGPVETLADFLLEALGAAAPLEQGGAHEHQDHA